MEKAIISLLIISVISYAITPSVIAFAKKYKLVDDKNKRFHPANTHRGVIPRAGGLGILAAILVGILIFIPLNKIMIGVIFGAILVVIVGILDDYYNLSPYSRLIINFITVFIVILFGLGVPYITNPFGGVIRLDTLSITVNLFGRHEFLVFANIFAILWIVALMNFVNWSKGVDGQLPGFVAISSIFVGIFAMRFTAHDISKEAVSILAFIIGGAYLGFLPWNYFPQRIMPGYSGGTLAGYFLGILSILSFSKLGIIVMVLSIPLIDAIYTVIRRIIEFRSPFKGDAGHFHHRLLSIQWGKRRIAVFYWLVSFIFGVSALYLKGIEKILALGVTVVMLALFVMVIEKIKSNYSYGVK